MIKRHLVDIVYLVFAIAFTVLAVHWFEEGKYMKAWIDVALALGALYLFVRLPRHFDG